MTEQVTAERALEVLTRVVKREGRDTIRRCEYVTSVGEPKPLCIAAHVMVEVGVPIEVVASLGSDTFDGVVRKGRLADFVDFSDDAMQIVERAQFTQDKAESWGRALAHARRVAWQLGVIGRPALWNRT